MYRASAPARTDRRSGPTTRPAFCQGDLGKNKYVTFDHYQCTWWLNKIPLPTELENNHIPGPIHEPKHSAQHQRPLIFHLWNGLKLLI